jgi:hypothetical protein
MAGLTHMFKRLVTTLFLVAMVCNSVSVIPPHHDGEGGCGAECCAAARQEGPTATISAICCITDCRGSAETTTPVVSSTVLKQQQLSAPADCAPTLSPKIFYLQYAKFPVSPTRFLHGSSGRYLETGSLLI